MADETDKAAADEAAAAKMKERAEKAKAKGEGGKKKAPEQTGPAPKYKREKAPRLKATYDTTVRAAMMKEFSYSTVMQVPRIVKVSVNMGLGKAGDEPKMIEFGIDELKAITGQSPVVSRAKKDIAVFKLRKGQKIGVMVTLRRERMWEFLDRLLNIALPRVRDFRGVSSRGFDGRGNFTMGVREQIIFPGDRVRQDRLDQGAQHLDRHHGADRRGGGARSRTPRHAVPPGHPDHDHDWCARRARELTTPAEQADRYASGRKHKFKVRVKSRCKRGCGRPRAFIRKFGDVPLLLPRSRAQGRYPGASSSRAGEDERAFMSMTDPIR